VTHAALSVPLGVDSVVYGAYVAAWSFFAYGPQLIICLLFAWSACRHARGDLLTWLVKGFLWSLLPFVGVAVMWWIWRRTPRRAGGTSGEGAPPQDVATGSGTAGNASAGSGATAGS
jgi:hypothetical protein